MAGSLLSFYEKPPKLLIFFMITADGIPFSIFARVYYADCNPFIGIAAIELWHRQ
jgi:hypothetical protein